MTESAEFNYLFLGILIVANWPVYWFAKWIWFSDWAEFWESVRFWLMPDLFSLFRGEYFDDWWAEMKLGFWFMTCATAVGAEYFLLSPFVRRFF